MAENALSLIITFDDGLLNCAKLGHKYGCA